MKNDFNKKNIVKLLNDLFGNTEDLSKLCSELSNDYNSVIKAINKIIKGFFSDFYLVSNIKSLVSIYYIFEKVDVDSNYKFFLDNVSKNKSLFSNFKFAKKRNVISFEYLDSDIDISDLDELRIPSLDKIKEICDKNKIRIERMLDESKKEREKVLEKYNSFRGLREFDEVGFSYSRRELVTIASSFMYYNDELAMEVDKDFVYLYNKDRYTNSLSSLNPLGRSYEENISDIKGSSDISLFKKGKVYEIENGRHRILYILKNKKIEQIPVMVTRRFEDKEINIILTDLINNYNVSVYKNNILNDEVNLLVKLNGIAYVISNKEELVLLYNKIKNDEEFVEFNKISFDIANDNIDYKELIFSKYLELGSDVLTNDFTDLSRFFDSINNLYYNAFVLLQQEYQDSLVYGYDLKEHYEEIKNEIIRKNALFSQWDIVMGSNPQGKNKIK